jgi:heme-degrading monooxygenase HmoA
VIAVIFEVTPLPGKEDRYFEIATALRAEVEKIDGFISVERFASLTTRGKFVSLSFWRDAAAVAAWRAHAGHRLAQAEGRGSLFADFRIRVATVDRDYSLAG